MSVTGWTHAASRARKGAHALDLAVYAAVSALTNPGLKLIGRRTRPDRAGVAVPLARHVPMPRSTSFPSGHAASAGAAVAALAHGR